MAILAASAANLASLTTLSKARLSISPRRGLDRASCHLGVEKRTPQLALHPSPVGSSAAPSIPKYQHLGRMRFKSSFIRLPQRKFRVMDLPELGVELSSKLEEGILVSQIDDKCFLPLDFLGTVINKRNVELELKDLDIGKKWLRESPELPGRITGHAKKVFAALALMDKTGAIRSLLDEGLTDEYLPLSQHSGHEGLLSRNGEMHFPFSRWRVASVNEFVRRKQWLFLAPVLDTSGRLIKVDPECPLPFVDSEIVDNGAAGIVHRAKLHPAHQNGYRVNLSHSLPTIRKLRAICRLKQ